MKIISIANQKGGVGKTTTTMALGAALSALDKRVLLIDFDPQGNLSDYLRYEPDGLPTVYELLLAAANGTEINVNTCIRHNEIDKVDYIPATLALSGADVTFQTAISRESMLKWVIADPAFKDYDYVLIDCSPYLGLLTLNAFTASDAVLIPVQAQKFAMVGMESLMQLFATVQRILNPRLHIAGVLQTMHNRTNMAQAVATALCSKYGDLVFETVIHNSTEAANSTARRQSLVSYKNKLGNEYSLLAQELLEREGDALRE